MMPPFIHDTDIFSLLTTKYPEVVRRVNAQTAAPCAITVITVEEQVSGWYSFLRKATRPDQIEFAYQSLGESVMHLARLPIVPYPQAAIDRYEILRKQKLNVRANDLRIAAIALELGAVVVTRNVRDFTRVPSLLVEDWSQPPGP